MTFVLNLPIKLVLKDPQKFKEDAKEYFENHQRLKPVRFGYTVHYAESLEYGTGPLSNYQPTVNGGNYTYKKIWDDIYEWAGKKDSHGGILPIKDKEERKAFTDKVVQRMFNYGMRPHPYWRPAINWLIENEQVKFDEGLSLYEIADEALRISNKCIMDQNLPYSGQLQLSAFIDEIDLREHESVKDYKDYTEDERNAKFKQVGWM